MNDDHWDEVSKDVNYKIYNAQVLYYLRIDPVRGERNTRLRWFQSVCPWADDKDESWYEIIRKKYSNEDLLD